MKLEIAEAGEVKKSVSALWSWTEDDGVPDAELSTAIPALEAELASLVAKQRFSECGPVQGKLEVSHRYSVTHAVLYFFELMRHGSV